MNDSKQKQGASVHVIINPAAGQDAPFLKVMNDTFKADDIDYEVLITKEAGDAFRLAQEAVADGADIVAAYGGDGTVIEVASGLVGSRVPLAILPGGTANMLSKAFGIPQDFAQAVALIAGALREPGEQEKDVARQWVSLAQVGENYFSQLVGIGMEAKIVEGADRQAKDRLGMLAYGLAALQAINSPLVSKYHLWLDDEQVDVEGVTCLISIVKNLNMPSLERALSTDDHPEELDVIVLQGADLSSFVSLLATVAGAEPNTNVMHHWHARHVKIEIDPAQGAQADGEALGDLTAVDVRILPKAIQLITPPAVNPVVGQGS
jgi:diacylglycerol kinase (ATP)